MALPFSRLVIRTSHELALSRLDQSGLALYAFLLRKLGYSAVPRPVAISYMAEGTKMSVKRIRRRLKQLEDDGLIQKWTVKHPTHYKKTFYRIVYIGDKRALYRRKSSAASGESKNQ